DFFVRLARSYEFSYVPTVEVDYRRHAGNATNNYWQVVRELRAIHARTRQRSPHSDTAAQALREGGVCSSPCASFQAIDAARSAFRTRKPFAAASHLARAAMLCPSAVRQSGAAFIKGRLDR